MRPKGWQANLAILAVSTALTVLSLEAGFRVRAYVKDIKAIEKRAKLVRVMKTGRYEPNTEAFALMVRENPNGRIVYDLMPHLGMKYRGVLVKTNSVGFRDVEYRLEKKPGAVRVFGIGDSVMFGQGAPQGEDYLSQLELRLNKEYPSIQWDVINSGVPEYNTVLEVETLKEKGLPYSPDIVVLGFCDNDLKTPVMAQLLGFPEKIGFVRRYLALNKSFLYQYALHRLGRSGVDVPIPKAKHVSLGGGERVVEALNELKALSLEHGFEVVVLFFAPQTGDVGKEFMRISRGLGFHIVDAGPSLRAYMKENGIDNYFGSALTVADNHPSPLGHRIASDTLFDYLEKNGLIRKLLKDVR